MTEYSSITGRLIEWNLNKELLLELTLAVVLPIVFEFIPPLLLSYF